MSPIEDSPEPDMNFYFWLGENAELFSNTEEEFERNQHADRLERVGYLYVS